jgi:hypothetical protein
LDPAQAHPRGLDPEHPKSREPDCTEPGQGRLGPAHTRPLQPNEHQGKSPHYDSPWDIPRAPGPSRSRPRQPDSPRSRPGRRGPKRTGRPSDR